MHVHMYKFEVRLNELRWVNFIIIIFRKSILNFWLKYM